MTAMLTAPVLVASLVMLTSCIDSADDLDPSDWYSSAVGAEPAPEPGDVPGSDADYPELGSVPEEPVNVSSVEEIDRVAESLAADLANAQYTSGVSRADDETTPSEMPLPSVAAVESESITVITPGEEIEIAEATVATVPAVEPVESASAVSLVAPPTESQVALADEIASDTLVIVPAQPAMDVAVVVPVESRIETETIRDEDGELVGSITTVVETSLVSGDQSEADMMMAVAAAENMEPVEETIVVMQPVSEPSDDPGAEMVTVAEPINENVDLPGVDDETLVIVSPPTPESQSVTVAAVPETAAVDDGSASLVALSERSASDTIVVVPEYMASADISTPEPVGTVASTVEPEVTVEVLEPATTTRVEVVEVPAQTATAQVEMVEVETAQASANQVGAAQMEQENFVTEDGELVGSVTRVIETTMVMKSDGEPVELVTQSEEVEMAVLEPEPAAERVSVTDETLVIVPATTAPAVTQPSVTTASVPVISSAGVSFDDLFGASSPNAGAATQNVAAVGSPTTTINDATFTTAGTGNAAQTLAAIIRFGNGSSALGADERHIVAQLAAIYAQTGGPIRLVGHASKSGGNLASTDAALVNFKISLDRATAVANELIRNGVPRGDILVEAAAATDSMAADAGMDNEAVDRRVEVFFGV